MVVEDRLKRSSKRKGGWTKQEQAEELMKVMDFIKSMGRPVSAIEIWEHVLPDMRSNYMTFFRRLRLLKKMGLIGLIERKGFTVWDVDLIPSHAREQGKSKGEPFSDGEPEEVPETESEPKE